MNRSVVVGLTLASCVALVASASACNRRVFEKVQNSCDRTIASDVDVPTEKAADILIVVDNSGSMQEEQTNLANNFFNEDPGECPLTDLANIPEEYKNPPRALYTAGGALSGCGFIQLLAAFENDFRVGVITTDVGLCDNRFPAGQAQAFCSGAGAGRPECSSGDAQNLWGFRPQRGCLQPDGPVFGNDLHKLIQKSDLQDANLDDLAGRFKRTLENIRVFGSAFERGLDAATMFLNPNTSRHESCENDLASFRRDDAQLVVIFLSDEEDCSHGGDGIPGGASGNGELVDENAGEVCAQNAGFFNNNARGCYNGEADLPSAASYADKLKGVEEGVKVAIIAGGVGEPGSVEAGGCRTGGGGTPDGNCFTSGGLSNFTGDGEICSNNPQNPLNDPVLAAAIEARGCGGGSCDIPCCQADAGDRYFSLASEFEGKALTDSICNASFRETMLDIAAFIAAVDFVELAEAPESPNAIVVEIESAGSGDVRSVAPLANADDCVTETGWILEGERRIVLCGDARPGPGDKVKVRARGTNDTDACQ